MPNRWLPSNPLKTTRKAGGRPRFSRNKKSKFDRDQCMDILHEVAARPENRDLSVYQVIDTAAREIIDLLLERKSNDEQFRETHIAAVRKQLQRDQEENDSKYLSSAEHESEDYDRQLEIYKDHDPNDGPEGPPPRPYEEVLEEITKNDPESYRLLPQGFTHSAMKAHFIGLRARQPVCKRRLKRRD